MQYLPFILLFAYLSIVYTDEFTDIPLFAMASFLFWVMFWIIQNKIIVNPQQNNEHQTEEYKRHSIPQSVKDKVWNRDSGKCVQCGSNQKLEFDHIIPHSKGGANTYRSLDALVLYGYAAWMLSCSGAPVLGCFGVSVLPCSDALELKFVLP